MEDNIKKIIQNFLIDEENFEKNKVNIEKVSEIIANKIINNERIVFVCVGYFADILNGLAKDIEYNFGIKKDLIKVLHAGYAFKRELNNWKEMGAIESAAVIELENILINKKDLIIGISSSGKTSYILGALSYGKEIGAKTVLITNEKESNLKIKPNYTFSILPKNNIANIRSLDRITLRKMIFDILIYSSIEKSGRIYKNRMPFMKWNSEKTKNEILETISIVSNISFLEAKKILKEADGISEVACVMALKKINKEKAISELKNIKYNFNKIIF